ncbi:MAG: 16S rRNA (cytosine(1402)-N(4))-methyltransferase RsmH [Candidatus Moranbacteria bacterium]|nr:16S rRNA (cytosine(1402)-N(4))-methyltransferase RsmH [Candidatus Moranbacteria bacterium]
MKETLHVPVLLQAAVAGLEVLPGSVVVDATLGGGGHTREILRRVSPGGSVIALDTDADALDHFRKAARSDEFLAKALAKRSLILVHKNYSLLGGVLEDEGIETVDAILADLGFSSDQIEDGERGFSFQKSGPLDMRLDQETELTAGTIVNTFSQGEIEKILREYGDESESRRIARAIVVAREKKPFVMTSELSEIIESAYPKGKRYRSVRPGSRQGSIHPATKTFQALRIAVNREFEHLEQFLSEAVKHLRPGGRLAVITFHSGEDRIVQQFFKKQIQGCICPPGFPLCRCGKKSILKILTKKPIAPDDQEVKDNPRSRSAKLRIAEKL